MNVTHIRETDSADVSLLKQWYQRIGFEEGKTEEFSHLPFQVTFMIYPL
jgi:hypothetical protein